MAWLGRLCCQSNFLPGQSTQILARTISLNLTFSSRTPPGLSPRAGLSVNLVEQEHSPGSNPLSWIRALQNQASLFGHHHQLRQSDRSSKLEVIFVLLPTSTMPGHQPLDLLRQTLNEAIREKVAGFDWNRVCLLPSISLRIDVFLQQEEGASVGDASSVKSVMSVSLSDKSGIFRWLL